MAIQAPSDMNSFFDQATKFVTKAKADGIDENRIANTVRFMYGLTQQNMASQKDTSITPYQQAQLDIENKKLGISEQGTWRYNSDTGEYFNENTGTSKAAPNSDTTIGYGDFGITPQAQTTQASTSPSFDFDSAANSFSWTQPVGVTQPSPKVPQMSMAPTSSKASSGFSTSNPLNLSDPYGYASILKLPKAYTSFSK